MSFTGASVVSGDRPADGGKDTPAGHVLRGGVFTSFSCSIPQSVAVYRAYSSMRDTAGRFARSTCAFASDRRKPREMQAV